MIFSHIFNFKTNLLSKKYNLTLFSNCRVADTRYLRLIKWYFWYLWSLLWDLWYLSKKIPKHSTHIFRFGARERAAVTSWLKSDHPFHIMRDHPDHVNKILGGMWGAKLNDKTRHRYKELLVKMLENVSFYKKDKLS